MAAGDIVNTIKSSYKNIIINGAMDFWQRGVSNTITNSAAFTLDRFKDVALGSTIVTGISREEDSPNNKSKYSHKVTVNTLDTMGVASDVVSILHNIEGYNVASLFGKKVSFGFWVKSNAVGTYSATLSTTSGAGNSYIQEFEIFSSDTWELKKFEGILLDNAFMNGDNTTGVGLVLHIMLDMGSGRKVSTLNQWVASASSAIGSSNQVAFAGTASNYFQMTQVMLHEGDNLQEFKRAGESISEELQLCQRYYHFRDVVIHRFHRESDANYDGHVVGGYTPFPVEMRVTASITLTQVQGWLANNTGWSLGNSCQPYAISKHGFTLNGVFNWVVGFQETVAVRFDYAADAEL